MRTYTSINTYFHFFLHTKYCWIYVYHNARFNSTPMKRSFNRNSDQTMRPTSWLEHDQGKNLLPSPRKVLSEPNVVVPSEKWGIKWSVTWKNQTLHLFLTCVTVFSVSFQQRTEKFELSGSHAKTWDNGKSILAWLPLTASRFSRFSWTEQKRLLPRLVRHKIPNCLAEELTLWWWLLHIPVHMSLFSPGIYRCPQQFGRQGSWLVIVSWQITV